jgi:anhydro-N-acetylmuramic acid kinase
MTNIRSGSLNAIKASKPYIMRHHIQQLAQIARKRSRRIIGLMSGTSLDGLDVALCVFTGSGMHTKVKVEQFTTLPYPEAFKQEVWRVFAKKEIDFQHLTLLNVMVAEHQATLINQCLKAWGIEKASVDAIASHGQTVFHAPRIFHGLPEYPNATLQIGDGDHIAMRTGMITLSDFRQKHCAAGGEGAPLALYGDYFLFSKKGENRFLLNLGGIANFTYLPADGHSPSAFATDTGPGNTLLDAFARLLFNKPFDEDARLALAGKPDPQLLAALKTDPFFAAGFPKTAGPESFNPDWVYKSFANIYPSSYKPDPHDLMATLAHLTAETVLEAMARVQTAVGKNNLYLSGGGSHNPLIVKILKQNLHNWQVYPMQKLKVNGDAKEAVLFAVLANECLAGTQEGPAVLGGVPLVSMGKISLPG